MTQQSSREQQILTDQSVTAHGPVTRDNLASDFARLGVRPGMLLNVHSSLSRLGWVAGGAQTVILALLDALGPEGTLMMPAHSGQLSEPANWRLPAVPESWWPLIRDQLPAFDRQLTPTRNMGAIAELFRTWPESRRSSHPQVSHAARGPLGAALTNEHPLECLFGDRSPMGKLYETNGYVLLVGVDHGNNSLLHLAEERAQFPGQRRDTEGAPIIRDGVRVWQRFRPLAVDDSDFKPLGEAFARGGREQQGPVGAGVGRLMQARELVDFAVPWLEASRASAS